MLNLVAAALIATLHSPGDTTIVLGRIERDLTGDGAPETLTVTAVGPNVDSLMNVTFTIATKGHVVYTYRLAPLTRTVGFDGGRHTVSAAEHRTRLREFSNWFFDGAKFRAPAAFVAWLETSAREHVAAIPDVITLHREPQDSSDARAIWRDMLKAPITVFTFSPGGDAIVAIGWSERTQRFYRLLECC